jgi:hypothetical protein
LVLPHGLVTSSGRVRTLGDATPDADAVDACLLPRNQRDESRCADVDFLSADWTET